LAAQHNEYFERSETDGELLPVVDENDTVIRLATRREIHTQRLLHRAVHVVLFDVAGRILLQKRSQRKDHLPGWWDVSVGGHVGPDEEYLQAAIREIGEEMGIPGASPQWIGRQEPCEATGWEFIHVFAYLANGEVRPDRGEIDEIAWLTIDQYQARMADNSGDWRMSAAGDRSIRMLIAQTKA